MTSSDRSSWCPGRALRRLGSVALVAMLLGEPRLALAQSAPDPAAAALFRSGRDRLAAGDWAGACAKFEASMARYASASTLLNIARCREHEGKVASAWAAYKQALVLNQSTPGEERRKELGAIAVNGAAELEPRLPYLRVVVPAAPPQLVVKQDGLQVLLGESLPIDPGEHVVAAEAPGFRSERRVVTLVEGKTLTLELVLTAASVTGPIATVPSAPIPSPVPRPPSASPAPSSLQSDDGGIPGWVWGVGLVGLASGGVATGFAVDAMAANRDANAVCGSDARCDESRGEVYADTVPHTERQHQSTGLAIGFGAASVIGIGAALMGIASSGPSRSSTSRSSTGGGFRVWTAGRSTFAGGSF